MNALTPRGWLLRLGALLLLALLCAVAALGLGAEWISPRRLLSGDPRVAFILLDLRLPRVLAGLFVGGALAACGAAFQALLRNPLASPFVLGVSGGGSLGAVLAIVLGLDAATAWLPLPIRPLFAFAGCLAALLLIYAVARQGGRLRPEILLLAGVVANAFFLSVMGFLQYVASPHQAQEILRWMMGGLFGITMGAALLTGAIVLAGTVVLTALGRDLNVLSLGEETAVQLGVPAARVRRRVFVVASLMTGAAVAVAGPVAFVGLFVPHAVRLTLGSDHRLVVPASFLAGGAVLVLADAAARVAASPGEMPVGLLTAALGAPLFLVLLARGRAGRIP
ncbi:MAG: iron ABC transporter permease [Planctomycetes bacterium]|jgi:iron complex transport system permease protein|nr:iron ABC transporter permease [Planctomycetota bacterium]